MGKLASKYLSVLGAKNTRKNDRRDMWLVRSAHASQVFLFALGLFGYFWTVRPFYQSQVTAEENARMTSENNYQKVILSVQLNTIELNKKEIINQKNLISSGQKEIEESRSLVIAAKQSTNAAQQKEAEARALVQTASLEVASLKRQILRLYLTASLKQLQLCIDFTNWRVANYEIGAGVLEACHRQYFNETEAYAGDLDKVDIKRYAQLLLGVCSKFWAEADQIAADRERILAPYRRQLIYVKNEKARTLHPDGEFKKMNPEPNLENLDEDWKVELGLGRYNSDFAGRYDELGRRVNSSLADAVNRMLAQ